MKSCVLLLAAILDENICNTSAQHHTHGMAGSETNGLNGMLREIYGGSKLRDFVHNFMEPIPDRIIGTSASKVTQLPSGEMEQTFISPAMSLSNGHVMNRWLPIDWPRGHISIKALVADLVKASPDGEEPPPEPCCGGPHEATRKEVFMHHWTVNKWQLPAHMFEEIVKQGGWDYDLNPSEKVRNLAFMADAGLNSGANGPCWDSDLHMYFGIGNEVRSKTKDGKFPFEFPEPYGVEFDSEKMRRSGEFMVLNTHLIDLRDINDKRGCSECKCSELGTHGFFSVTEGGLSCCHSTVHDGGKCKLKPNMTDALITNQTYYMRYTIRWRNFDPATTLPLEVITFDATDNNTKWADLPFISGGFMESHAALRNDATSMARVSDGRSGDFDGQETCHVEWYVPACKPGDECIVRITNSWELPYPMHIVFLRNHFHAGGSNMTTWTNDFRCTGHGTYDDDDNLVDVTTCTAGTGELANGVARIQQGETLHVESIYKQDDLPHYGAMSMSFVYAHIPRDQYVHV